MRHRNYNMKYYTNCNLTKDPLKRPHKPITISTIRPQNSIIIPKQSISHIQTSPMVTNNTSDKSELTKRNNYINDIDLLEYTFNSLGIDNSYLDVLYSNQINFDDLLLLTKEDLKEMLFPIGPRNRLLLFIAKYSAYSSVMNTKNKEQYELLENFFNKNKNINSLSANVLLTNQSLHLKSQLSHCDSSELIKEEIGNYLTTRANTDKCLTNRYTKKDYDNLLIMKKDLKNKLNNCNKSIRDNKEVSSHFYLNIYNRS